jgi:hypothetical protein
MSVITHQEVKSWDDFDFDTIFDQSASRLDANFFSIAKNVVTYEEKKQYYKAQIQSAFDGVWPLKEENETLFLYKGIYDDVVMEFCGGYIESDGITFRGHWYLTSPDALGSRNVIHTEEATVSRRAFYQQYGLSQYKVLTYVGSSMYQWMNMRINSGAITLVSQTEKPLDENTTHVTFIVAV